MADTKSVKVGDALADFTSEMARLAGYGGSGYRDGPFSVATGGYDWYRRSWLARAAVDALPDECFKKGYQWVAEDDQINLLEATEKRLGLKSKIRHALSMSRLDGVSYIYMDDAGQSEMEFRPDRVGKDGLRFINVLRKNQVTPSILITDPLSRWFGHPEYYTVTGSDSSVKIHPSRMIRMVNAPDPQNGEGRSVLDYMLEPIIAAVTARDNVVALTTEANIDIISVCNLFTQVQDPEEAKKIAGRYALLREGKATNKIAVLDKDAEEWTQRQVSFATLPDVMEAMRREAAAAIGMPYAILFGRPGGLGTNSETELKVWYDSVSAIQENSIDPEIAPLMLAVEMSALGYDRPEIFYQWLSLNEMTDKEKADVAKSLGETAGKAVSDGIFQAEMLSEPLMNAWTELGVFQGLEQQYNNMFDPDGGVDGDDSKDDEVDDMVTA